jgi:hypothetical protein
MGIRKIICGVCEAVCEGCVCKGCVCKGCVCKGCVKGPA